MPWKGVRQRFRRFHSNLHLTHGQLVEGISHYQGVCNALNAYYYSSNSVSANSFLTGSWGKNTKARPPRDIDVYFVLPVGVYERFQVRVWNRQSQLLQEVRNVLLTTYPSTKIKGDGPVVVVGFNRMSVEVIPAFLLDNGRYWICDTKNGGRYMTADPKAEIQHVWSWQALCNNNVCPLVMMAKAWQRHCHVPLKSFILELLVIDFLSCYQYRLQDYFYYDWFFRDFYAHLLRRVNGSVSVPRNK